MERVGAIWENRATSGAGGGLPTRAMGRARWWCVRFSFVVASLIMRPVSHEQRRTTSKTKTPYEASKTPFPDNPGSFSPGGAAAGAGGRGPEQAVLLGAL